uniref:Uncharacterized protein n=1 Tax=Anguilla anguilla TaxID=7936 RepID=A0A0E9TJM0_ANGAN
MVTLHVSAVPNPVHSRGVGSSPKSPISGWQSHVPAEQRERDEGDFKTMTFTAEHAEMFDCSAPSTN